MSGIREAIHVVVDDTSLDDLKFVLRRLGVSEPIIEDIEKDHSENARECKYKMLHKWHTILGSEATIDVLVKGLFDCRITTTAEKLAEKFNIICSTRDFHSYNIDDVCKWLKNIAIDESTISVFRENRITGKDMIEFITKDILLGEGFELSVVTASKILHYRDSEIKKAESKKTLCQPTAGTASSLSGDHSNQSPGKGTSKATADCHTSLEPLAMPTQCSSEVDKHPVHGRFGKEKKEEARDPGHWTVQLLGNMQHGKEPGLFQAPRGLAWHKDRLVVCDQQNHRVQILNKAYNCDEIIRFDDRFEKSFQPWDVTVSPDDHYLITDTGNNQVITYDHHSKQILHTINLPDDVSVGGVAFMAGYVWITDYKGYRLMKYTRDGRHVATVGGKGSKQGEFDKPHSLAATSKRNLLVTEENNHRIQVFDSEMNPLRSYCSKGNGPGQVHRLCGIDVDGRDNIYICDWGNDRLSNCDPTESLIEFCLKTTSVIQTTSQSARMGAE
ncbi:uncharacterized protein [Ptychodera flava]|uniref:uncharacterized protein n=1 Tax=Ptychodera flava TaxID=63121 RepID=UPI00396A6442